MAEKGTKGPGHTRITQTRLKRTTPSSSNQSKKEISIEILSRKTISVKV